MNLCSEDVKDMLASVSSLGLAFSANLFIGKTPDQPDNAVTIYDTQGFPPTTSLDGKSFYHSSVQIKVRNRSYVEGGYMINAIMNSLHGRAQETWNGTLYSSIFASSDVAFLRWDENGNVEFVINFNLNRR